MGKILLLWTNEVKSKLLQQNLIYLYRILIYFYNFIIKWKVTTYNIYIKVKF